jgi:hypothetical protein
MWYRCGDRPQALTLSMFHFNSIAQFLIKYVNHVKISSYQQSASAVLQSTFTSPAWHFVFTIPPRSGETEQSADSAQKQYAAANTAARYLEEGRAIVNAFPHRESYKGARNLCSDVNEALIKDGNSTDNYASMDQGEDGKRGPCIVASTTRDQSVAEIKRDMEWLKRAGSPLAVTF